MSMKKFLKSMEIATSDVQISIKLFLVINSTTSDAVIASLAHKQITGSLSMRKAGVLCEGFLPVRTHRAFLFDKM